jgi:hypothetical protein
MNKDYARGRQARRTYGLLTAILLTVLGLSAVAFGQKDTGAIEGTVRDPAGAVVSGAKVTVADADRGTSVTVTTNGEG